MSGYEGKRPVSIANRSATLEDGRTVAYYDSGERPDASPALVLLHGYCGSSAYWEKVAGRLAASARVIAPDARGHGLSGAPEDEIYGMEAYADDLEQLLGALGIARAIVLGHSLGGYIALAYAERYRQRLTAFGLIHSTPLPDGETARENRDKAVRTLESDGVAAFVDGLVPKLFAADRLEELAAEVRRGKEIGYGTSRHGAAATAKGMKERPDRTAVIAGAEVPVLLLAGLKDGVVPSVSTFAAAGSRTVRVELPDAGHMSMLECPDRLAAELEAFIKLAGRGE